MTRAEILQIAKPIYQDAINRYGEDPQIDMAIEEMSELTKALLKHRRAVKNPAGYDFEKTKQNIIEEIADVQIMIEQLILMFNCDDEVNQIITKKTERLDKRLIDYCKNLGLFYGVKG